MPNAQCPIIKLLKYAALCLAIACFPQAMALPDMNEGIQLYNHGNFRQALSSFEQAVRQNPKSSIAYYYLAVCYQQLGNYAKARELYTKIWQEFPQTAEAKMAAQALGLNAATQLPTNAASSAPKLQTARPEDARQANAQIRSAEGIALDGLTETEWERLPARGDVPFRRGPGGHLYVQAVVNGSTTTAIFDTGAAVCAFGKNHLAQLGIAPNLSGPVYTLSGVGAQKNKAQSMPVSMTIGNITRHLPIVVQDNLPTPPLIGETFYSPYDYDIDNMGGVIHFTKKAKSGKSTADRGLLDSVAVPFRRQGNNLVVTAKINGRPCDMYFDTGAASICFSFAGLRAMGIAIPPDAVPVASGGVGGATPALMFNVDRIELGPVLKTNVPIVVVEFGSDMPLLGQPFFHDRTFTIDNDNNVIRFAR